MTAVTPTASSPRGVRTTIRVLTVTASLIVAVVATLLALTDYPGTYNQMLTDRRPPRAADYAAGLDVTAGKSAQEKTADAAIAVCGALDPVRAGDREADDARAEVLRNLHGAFPALDGNSKQLIKAGRLLVEDICPENSDPFGSVLNL